MIPGHAEPPREHAEMAWGKGFMRAKRGKNFQLIHYLCRHGQLINGAGSTCLHASEFVYTNCESITDYSTQTFTH